MCLLYCRCACIDHGRDNKGPSPEHSRNGARLARGRHSPGGDDRVCTVACSTGDGAAYLSFHGDSPGEIDGPADLQGQGPAAA